MKEIKMKCDRCGKEAGWWMYESEPVCKCIISFTDDSGMAGKGSLHGAMDLCNECFSDIVKFAHAGKFIK